MKTTDKTKTDLVAFASFIVGRLNENSHRGQWETLAPDAPRLVAKLARKVEKLAAALVIGDQRAIRRHSADLGAWALKAFTVHGTPNEDARLAAALGRQ